MSNKMKVLERLHTLTNKEQAKVLQDLTDNGETERTPQAEMTAYNIEDIVNSLPDKYKMPIVEAVNNYTATGKEPDDTEWRVFAYLGVAVWEVIKHHIDALQATQGGGCPTNH